MLTQGDLRRCLLRSVGREKTVRGCSSVGRASALQAEGHGFKSLHLHWKMIDG